MCVCVSQRTRVIEKVAPVVVMKEQGNRSKWWSRVGFFGINVSLKKLNQHKLGSSERVGAGQC